MMAFNSLSKAALASRQRRSMADCIREGIHLLLDRTEARADDLSDIAGKFRPVSLEDLKEVVRRAHPHGRRD